MNQQLDFERIIDKYELWERGLLDNAKEVSQQELYDQMLDECSPENFNVPDHWGNSNYSKALFENDPVAYRCGFADYTDTMREDYFEGPDESFYEVESMKDAINEALDVLIEQILDAINEAIDVLIEQIEDDKL